MRPYRDYRGRLIFFLLIITIAIGEPVFSDSQTLSLRSLIEQALDNNPSLKASAASVEASTARVPQAGTLPDPRLSVGVMNLPVDTFEFDQEPMTQINVGVSQTIPYSGKLSNKSHISEQGLQTDKYQHLALKQDLVYSVRKTYYELVFLDRAIEITGLNLDLMRELAHTAGARYAVGMGIQQDPLKAQVELSRLIDQRIGYEQEKIRSVAELNRLINAAPGDPVPPTRPEAERPPLPDRDKMISMARERNPRLLAARSLADQARSAEALARLSPNPDLTLMLNYGFREDGEVQGQKVDRPDFFSASASVPIPVWKKRKQDQELIEKQARREQAISNEDNLERQLIAMVEKSLAHAKRNHEQIMLLTTGIIPQARQSLESARAGYETGKVDFLTLLDNQVTLYRQELRLARLQSEYFQILAELDQLSGKPIEEILKGEAS